jgi:hypothetical protein
MDYKKIYNNLISSRMLIKDIRIDLKKNGHYFEKHHITPKCKGGDNSKTNIVYLTAREHFIAHWLLWLIFKDRQMALAFHKMFSRNNNHSRNFSSKDYEKAREAFRLTNIGNTYGKNNKGRVISEKQRENHSKVMKGKFIGEKNPFYNKKHSDDTKKILSDKRKKLKNEDIYNYKGFKLIYKDGVYITKFKTVKEVSIFIETSESNIRNVLGGNQKTAKGYTITHSK